MSAFVHQVELKMPEAETPERMRRIDGWCGEWQIEFHVLDRQPGAETVRIAFEDLRLARAFVAHFGGVLVEDDEVERAFAADEAFEDAYERLAREFNG